MKTKLNFDKTSGDDGIFWMEFDDFVYHYDTVYLCRIFNTASGGDIWNSAKCEGEWKGESAAGCSLQARRKVNNNPQFKLTVTQVSDVVVTLRQSNVLAKSRSVIADSKLMT
jgi:hypothetical protein